MDVDEDEDPDCTVIVEDVPGNMDTEDLELYFESEKHSGGAEIIGFARKKSTVTIVYAEKEVAQRVLKRKHELDGISLDVQSIHKRKSTNSILVSNCGSLADDKLDMFFSNRNKSGGGVIEMLKRLSHEDVVIKYKDPAVAISVLSRSSLELKGTQLNVQPYHGPDPITLPAISPKSSPSHVASELRKMSCEDVHLPPIQSPGSKTSERAWSPIKGNSTFEKQDAHEKTQMAAAGTSSYQDLGKDVREKTPTRLGRTNLYPDFDKEFHSVLGADMSMETDTVRETMAKEKDSVPMLRVVVTNIPSGTSEDMLIDFLESRRHTGGTEVKRVTIKGKKAAVEFQTEEDAAKVVALKTKPYIDTAKTELNFSWPKQTDGTTVVVSGFKRSTDGEHLCLFLESRRIEGGEVEAIQVDKNRRRAIVTFKDPKVAQRMLNKRDLTLEGDLLEVAAYDEDEVEEDKFQDFTPITNTIQVSGIEKPVDDDLLKLFFESKKKCGGGPIERIQYDKEKGTAVIVYQTVEDAASVLAHSNLSLSGNRIRVVGVENTNTMMGEESCAVVVQDVKSDNVDIVVMTLEGRRCANSNAETHFYDKETSKLIVTFQSPQAVQKILQLQPITTKSGLTLDLDVMSPSVSAFIVSPPLETNKIIARGLSKNVTPNALKRFIKSGAKQSVAEVVYGLQPGIAMCVFMDEPDLKCLKALCQSKPLCDSMLVIQRISQTDRIQVYPNGGMKEELEGTIPMYFENKRSGGENVTDSQPLDNGIIIQFADPQTVERVLSKCPHKIGAAQLHVAAYYDFLGELPPGLDTSSPAAWMQSCIDITDADERIVGYIIKKPEHTPEFDTVMPRYDTEIDWPLQPHGSIQLKCTLKYTDPNFAEKSQLWPSKSQEAFAHCMAKFDFARVDTLQEIWQQVTEELKGQERDHPSLLIVLDSKATCINITGPKAEVLTFSKKAHNTAQKHEAELKRRKTKITEKLSKFKQWQLELFEILDIEKSLLDLFPQLKMEIKTTEQLIELEGTPDEISKVKVVLYSEATKYQTKVFDLSKPMVGFVGSQPVLQELKASVKSKGLKVAVQMQGNQIKVHAGSKEDAVKAISFVKHYACHESIDVDDKATRAMKTDCWKKFKDNLITAEGKNKSSIYFADNKVIICCLTEKRDSIAKKVRAFIDQNTMSTRMVPFDYGALRLIECYHKQRLDAIERKHADKQLKLETVTEGRTCGLSVECSRTAVEEVSVDIAALKSSCICKEHPISSPGMPQYFAGDSGQNALTGIEGACKVAIEIKGATRVHGEKQPTITQTFPIPGGGELAVVHGDLTLCDVDAIVNAANDRMDHGAGVAFAIVKRGGESIQKECSDFVHSQGPLKKGQVYVSAAGNLTCNKVIHTVGPTWKGGSQNEEKDLHEAVVQALEAANKHHLKSVALPAISSGIFGFPLDKCVRTIHAAIFGIATSVKDIKQVQLVSNNRKHIQVFVDVFSGKDVPEGGADEDVYVYDKGMEEAGEVYESDSHEYEVIDEDEMEGRSSGDEEDGDGPSGTESPFKAGTDSYTLLTQEGITIKLVKGAIAKQKVDVIVNTTTKDLKLSSGAVSSSILSAAGSGIQDEASRAAPSGIAGGQIVQTSPGSLHCKQIYHGYCPGYKQSTCEEDLMKLMTTCLATAVQQGHTSIAFSAIGTGKLGIPPHVSARWMFSAATEFSKKTPSSSVKMVFFVLYDRDREVLKAFGEELKSLLKSGHSREATRTLMTKTRPARRSPAKTMAHTKAGFGDSVVSRIHGYSSCRTPYSVKTSEDITVQIVKGKLAEQQVDVIVNTTTRDLKLKSGALSSSLLKAAGGYIQDECEKNAPNGIEDPGEVVETSAGQLRGCQAIYHTHCPPYSNKACQQTVLKLMTNCLQLADQGGMTSIAFPAIGTGMLKVPSGTSAKWMYDAVAKYSKANSNTGLKNVLFVVFDADSHVLKDFDEFRKSLTGGGSSGMATHRRGYDAGPDETEDDEEVTTEIEGVTIKVRAGDICEEETDAIVNGTNSRLDLNYGAVSKSILKCGGDSIAQECREAGRTNRHGIAVTSAGRLNCKHIIHADIRQTDALEKRVMSCLYTAEEKNMQSIAFPALGTGGRSSTGTAAGNLLGGIKKFINDNNPQSVQLIHITVFQPSLVSVYKKAMAADSGWGFIKMVKGFFGATGGEKTERTRKHSRSTKHKPKRKLLGRHPFELTFQIFGFDDDSISRTVKKIDKHCEDETRQTAIDDPNLLGAIKKLTKRQKSRIHELQNEYPVLIKIDPSSGISIEGHVQHLSDVVSAIHKLLREVDTKAHADLIAKQVQWKFCEGTKTTDYPPRINSMIEEAYKGDEKYAEWEENKHGKPVMMRVYFDNMIETVANKRGRSTPVIRRLVEGPEEGSGFALPTTWKDMSDKNFHSEVLNNSTSEYQSVHSKFKTSVGGARPIISIERIQNKRLFQQYQAHKAFLDKQNTKGHKNEKELWHGTSADTIEKINLNGFNRSFCGKNGTAIGNGVYFAVAASYSAGGYSAPDAHGHKHMYLTKVLTGEYTTGSAGLRAAPAKSGEILYDSVTNSPTNPNMFVIFHDAAAYPEYLIKFT